LNPPAADCGIGSQSLLWGFIPVITEVLAKDKYLMMTLRLDLSQGHFLLEFNFWPFYFKTIS
jgi:hypothetical protein